MRFRQDNVTKIRPPEGKADFTVWDEGMKGFGIRFRDGGVGVYVIQYKVNGRQGKMTLGSVTKVLLEDAKKQAHEHFAVIAGKVDPAIELAKRQAKNVSFKSKIDDYLAHLRKQGRTDLYVKDNKRSLGGDFGTETERAGYFAALHKYAFPEIDRGLIATELTKIEKEHGTGSMRNCRCHINAYLTWAFKMGLIESNPGEGTLKPPVVKRDRVLQPDEIGPVWRLLGDDDFGTICKLLFLTWARRDEIGSLRKSEVNLDKRLIDLPPARVKNGVRHVIPLSDQARVILAARMERRTDSEFVFGTGAGGYGGWHKPVVRLREAAAIPHFTLHDFRRTGRSLGVRRPVSIFPHIAEAILNHISSAESGKQGVAGVYDVNDPFQYHEEKVEALQKWADYIDGLTKPKLSLVA